MTYVCATDTQWSLCLVKAPGTRSSEASFLVRCPRFWTRTPSFEQRRVLLSLQSVMDIDEKI